MATYPTILAGQRATAALLTSMQPSFAYKLADETVNNVGTLQNDNELFLSVVPAVYELSGHLKYVSNSTANFQVGWTSPASTTMAWTLHALDNGAVSSFGDYRAGSGAAGSSLIAGGGSGSTLALLISGTVVVTTAGTLQLRWAQQVATVVNTIVYASSWIKLTRIS